MKRFVLLVLASVFSVSAFASNDCFVADDINSCMQKCDYEDNVAACSRAAYLHSKNNDAISAMPYHTKACALGYGRECSYAALFASKYKDYDLTKDLLKKGCELNDTTACLGLGFMYFKGEGVQQNRILAKKYFGEACYLGDEKACAAYRELKAQGF